jgi:hypothetical protein
MLSWVAPSSRPFSLKSRTVVGFLQEAFMSRTELEAELSKNPCYPLKNSLFVGKIPCSFQTRIFAETAAGRMFLRSATTSGMANF